MKDFKHLEKNNKVQIYFKYCPDCGDCLHTEKIVTGYDDWVKESYEFLSEHNGQIKYEKEQPGALNHYEPQWLDAVVVFAQAIMNEICRDALKSFIKSMLRKFLQEKLDRSIITES